LHFLERRNIEALKVNLIELGALLSTKVSDERLHIICDRPVGLFSLVQQVIATIPWAIQSGRTPIVLFGPECPYWRLEGYAGKENAWEYYFEPLVPGRGSDTIPSDLLTEIKTNPPNPFPESDADYYRRLRGGSIASSTFGYTRYVQLRGQMLRIPFKWRDPSRRLRGKASSIIEKYIRPRAYIKAKAHAFFESNLAPGPIIGIHARGTDALAWARTPWRLDSLILENYAQQIDMLLKKQPDSKLFVATDEDDVVKYFVDRYGDKVKAYESIRHEAGGEVAHVDSNGWMMPGYIIDREIAARNGEEAVIEFLLLRKSSFFLHNGSGLARTVLLADPSLPHRNVHLTYLKPFKRWSEIAKESLTDFINSHFDVEAWRQRIGGVIR
jgi:hypothetical protein